MKKAGILHKELGACLSAIGHGDRLSVVSCLYGIPPGAPIIDLALKRGIPKMIDVLQALVDEIIIEKIYIASEMELNHTELYNYIGRTFSAQIIEVIPNERLKELAARSKTFIRTGENITFSNMIVQAGFSSE